MKCILMCFNGQVAHSVVEHSPWSSPTQRMSSTTIDSLAIRTTALKDILKISNSKFVPSGKHQSSLKTKF